MDSQYLAVLVLDAAAWDWNRRQHRLRAATVAYGQCLSPWYLPELNSFMLAMAAA